MHIKNKSCIDCGKPIQKESVRCHSCAQKKVFKKDSMQKAIFLFNGEETRFVDENTTGSKALNKYWESQGYQSDTETIFFITQLLSLFPYRLVKRQFYFDDFYHPFDFAIPSAKLVFEIDGKQHSLPEVQKRDAEIDSYIENRGWKMIRYTNQQVRERDFQKSC